MKGWHDPRIPFIAVRDLQMPFARTDAAVHLTRNRICGRDGSALKRIASRLRLRQVVAEA